jgi:hypothetical protein
MPTPRFLRTSLAVVTAVAACKGLGGPDKPAVATVDVTLPATILIGDTVQANVVLRDGAGDTVGRGVTWTSGDPAIARVDNVGRVVGVGVGGPVAITASAGGKSGSANVSVETDTRFGYALADQPSATAPYAPDAAYRYNSRGGAVTITRSAVGTYSVTFAALGRSAADHDNVQVTAYGGASNFCELAGWQGTGTDLVVDVRCFTAAGAAADNGFTVLVIGAKDVAGRLGFLLSADPLASAPLDPATTYKTTAGPQIGLQRNAAGAFVVTFPGLGRVAAGSAAGMALMTAVGTGAERCYVANWDKPIGFVIAGCTQAGQAGAGVDSRFSVLWLELGRAGQRAGYAWAGAESSLVDYAPDTRFSLNSSGGPITAQRLGVGQYQLLFGGLGKGAGATETVQLGAFGGRVPGAYCTINSWGNTGADDLLVALGCYGPTGIPADIRYDLLILQ